MNCEDILERVEVVSYNECNKKSDLINVFNAFPELKKDLENQLLLDSNQEWIQKAKKEKFFFDIYNDSWKRNKTSFPNSLQLIFIGESKIPVISINIHKWPV